MIKKLLERKMFWITIGLFIISLLYFNYFTVSWDLNRSIGWGWDFTNYMMWIFFNPIFYFIIGYGIVYLLKRKTIAYLSAIHLVILFFGIFEFNNPAINSMLYFCSWGVFIANIISSKRINKESSGYVNEKDEILDDLQDI